MADKTKWTVTCVDHEHEELLGDHQMTTDRIDRLDAAYARLHEIEGDLADRERIPQIIRMIPASKR